MTDNYDRTEIINIIDKTDIANIIDISDMTEKTVVLQ